MAKAKKKSFLSRKNVLVAVCTLILLGGVLFVLDKKDVVNLSGKDAPTNTEETKTTSTTETAQEDFSSGDAREPGNSLNEGEGSSGISDNNGVIASGTDTNNPLVSSTGEITLYSPKANTSVSTGYAVTGASTLPRVSYRIIDSATGVIATGELTVVNGKFSGNLGFTTSADSGRLDVFGTKSDETEFSNIEVPIRFN